MIEIRELTKTYGDKTAVDHLTVTVRPGVVTGFLGPNGAGKSTTMRTIVGLDRPTGGEVLVNGRRYADHPAPLREVGALLEAAPSTRAAAPTTTCWPWPPPAGSANGGCTRSSTWSAWTRSRANAPEGSPWAWDSGWASPPRCSATLP